MVFRLLSLSFFLWHVEIRLAEVVELLSVEVVVIDRCVGIEMILNFNLWTRMTWEVLLEKPLIWTWRSKDSVISEEIMEVRIQSVVLLSAHKIDRRHTFSSRLSCWLSFDWCRWLVFVEEVERKQRIREIFFFSFVFQFHIHLFNLDVAMRLLVLNWLFWNLSVEICRLFLLQLLAHLAKSQVFFAGWRTWALQVAETRLLLKLLSSLDNFISLVLNLLFQECPGCRLYNRWSLGFLHVFHLVLSLIWLFTSSVDRIHYVFFQNWLNFLQVHFEDFWLHLGLLVHSVWLFTHAVVGVWVCFVFWERVFILELDYRAFVIVRLNFLLLAQITLQVSQLSVIWPCRSRRVFWSWPPWFSTFFFKFWNFNSLLALLFTFPFLTL